MNFVPKDRAEKTIQRLLEKQNKRKKAERKKYLLENYTPEQLKKIDMTKFDE